MNKRIVYTRPDGCVSIVIPSQRCYLACTGGGLSAAEPHRGTRAWMDRQVSNFAKGGTREDVARKWVEVMAFGGLTTAECFGLLRDKDVPGDGLSPELWDTDDISADRWFRDAWRRSPNGGPIWIDLDAARACQLGHIIAAVQHHNQAEMTSPARGKLWGHNGPELIEIEPQRWQRAVQAAQSLEEIRAVWPLLSAA
jgi:hypothetical protein